MLKELADKIEELVNGQFGAEIESIEGVDYIKTSDGYTRLRKPSVEPLGVNSLSGLVKMIRTSLFETEMIPDINLPLIVRVDVNDIRVYSSLDMGKDRHRLIRAEPLIPSLSLGRNLSVEELIILLSTAYIPTENTEKFINSISNLRIVEEVEFADDGIGQTVIAKQGASVNKSFQVQPIVKLKPIRSYAEIEQVESKFLFRVNKGGSVCLREADGGQWQYLAQSRIVEYLEKELKDLVKDNKVKIIG